MLDIRKKKGATLGLVVVTTLIVVLLGLCAFFLMGILGGFRQLHTATEAGALNFAKQALVNPAITLNLQNQYEKAAALIVGNEVNVKEYGALMSWAFLANIQADQDGNPRGISNARKLLAQIQSNDPQKNSIGYRLKGALERADQANNGLFLNVARQNRTNLLSSLPLQNNNHYSVGYLNENGATNVDIRNERVLQSQMPYNLDTGIQRSIDRNWLTRYGGREWFKGYSPLGFGGGSLFGVPVQPLRQPHGVSLALVQSSSTQPGANIAALPPNAFSLGALTRENHSGMNASSDAGALIGCNKSVNECSIPTGHLEIINTNATNLSDLMPAVTIPVVLNAAGTALGQGGVHVDPDSGVIARPSTEWKLYALIARNVPRGTSVDGLCNSSGHQFLNWTQAEAVVPQGDPNRVVVCTDYNTDEYGSNPEAACVRAANENNGTPGDNGNLVPPIDRVCICWGYPNCIAGYEDHEEIPTRRLSKLNVVEWINVFVGMAFSNRPLNQGQNITANGLRTGSSLWPDAKNPIQGYSVPYTLPRTEMYSGFNKYAYLFNQPDNLDSAWHEYCDMTQYSRVTHDGPFEAVVRQSLGTLPIQERIGGQLYLAHENPQVVIRALGGGPNRAGLAAPSSEFIDVQGGTLRTITTPPPVPIAELFKRSIRQRVKVIYPDAPEAQVQAAENVVAPIGKRRFIWRDRTVNPNVLRITETPPPNYNGRFPDGTPRVYTKTWEAFRRVVDPHKANGVTAWMFNPPTRGRVTVTQRYLECLGSGHDGACLGLFLTDTSIAGSGAEIIAVNRN